VRGAQILQPRRDLRLDLDIPLAPLHIIAIRRYHVASMKLPKACSSGERVSSQGTCFHKTRETQIASKGRDRRPRATVARSRSAAGDEIDSARKVCNYIADEAA
jgi:hypothetical protein